MSDPTLRTLDEWLRAAYDSKEAAEEAGCPPPEAFLAVETAGLSPEDRRTLDEHAARCPACAAERDLARLFDEAPDAAGVRPEDLEFVVSRLQETSPVRSAPAVSSPSAPNVVAFPGPRRAEVAPAAAQPRRSGSSHSLLRFAAAAILVMGAGLGYRAFQSPDPALPAPEIGGVVRGGEVEAVSPIGELAEVPGELRWAHRDGAASYRVRITTVDDSVLWEMKAPASPVVIPAEVSARLHRAVLYTWTVEALDPSGARLATSEPVRFRVRPAPR